jgi:transglutaminase-like putative cysteine protease
VKLGLRYQTVYSYEEPVSFSPHDLRLFPRTERFSRVRRFELQANGGGSVRYGRDAFDNVVASCFFPERMDTLRFELDVDLELEEMDAFDFILERGAAEMPFVYAPELEAVLAPYRTRQTSDELAVPGWTAPTAGAAVGTVSSLIALNQALHACIGYERREEGAAYCPAETLRLGRGACRDVSVLLAEILRDAGLAARLVSGYLREADAPSRRAEGSLHAWTEVFLPGAGWIGMDATNGVFCNHNFIAAAVGIRPEQITPIVGRYYHERKVTSEMMSRLELLQL